MTEKNKEIPVVILCGGLGSRFGSETESTPKPMLEIGGKPVLWHIMKIYSSWGFNNFILCLGYKSEVIKHYFMFNKEYNNNIEINLKTGKVSYLDSTFNEDWNVKLIETGLNTLKGGRIKRIEKYVETDRFMLTYGDGVAKINISDLIKFHLKHGDLGTLTGVNPPSRFGELISEGSKVISFSEKPQASLGSINGGFFVFENELFDYLTADEDCDFELGPLEDLAGQGKIHVYNLDDQWACMDNVRDWKYLNKLWYEKKAFWNIWEK